LTRLLNDLLDINRLEAGTVVMTLESINALEAVDGVVGALFGIDPKSQEELHIDFGPIQIDCGRF